MRTMSVLMSPLMPKAILAQPHQIKSDLKGCECVGLLGIKSVTDHQGPTAVQMASVPNHLSSNSCTRNRSETRLARMQSSMGWLGLPTTIGLRCGRA